MRRYVGEWKRWGRKDPYYAVLAEERYRRHNLDSSSRERFFALGEQYVTFILELVKATLGADRPPRRVLDFGCGVGRLAVPFAKAGASVVAVDISDSMIEEGKRNASLFGVEASIDWILADELFEARRSKFDLVNSYITFQHIPWLEGKSYIQQLLNLVDDGGIAVLHFLHSHPGARWKGFLRKLRASIPGVNALANVVLGNPVSTPHMEMNPYNINKVLDLFQTAGFGMNAFVFTDHGGFRGVVLIGRRVAMSVP